MLMNAAVQRRRDSAVRRNRLLAGLSPISLAVQTITEAQRDLMGYCIRFNGGAVHLPSSASAFGQ